MQTILSHPRRTFFPVWRMHSRSALLVWLDRQRQRSRLARLDQRLLDDIGVTRREAAQEARRWT